MGSGELAALREAAGLLGVPVSHEQAGKLMAFLDRFLRAARDLNLTAVHDREQALELHILDSLTVLRKMDLPAGARVVDVGSGGGLPGIPLQIMRSQWQVVLLDSARKRIQASLGLADGLGLQMEAVHLRAEEAGRMPGWRDGFEGAAARALAPLPTLLEYCLPLVKPGGMMVAMKGPGADEELEAAHRALAELRGEVEAVDRFRLPFSGAQRSLLLIRKTGPTPDAYPRRPGVPRQRPL